MLLTATCLKGVEIEERTVNLEELASALGIRPYCADLTLSGNLFPRLVAEIKDQDGKIRETAVTPGGGPYDLYRIRVFLFENAESRLPQRLIINLSADDNVAGNAFIDFPSESRSARTSTRTIMPESDKWFYEVWISAPDSPKGIFRVRLRIETSATPYPPPSSRLELIPDDHEESKEPLPDNPSE